MIIYAAQSHKAEMLESSAINDGWSMVAMLLIVLYVVEGLETEILKYDFI